MKSTRNKRTMQEQIDLVFCRVLKYVCKGRTALLYRVLKCGSIGRPASWRVLYRLPCQMIGVTASVGLVCVCVCARAHVYVCAYAKECVRASHFEPYRHTIYTNALILYCRRHTANVHDTRCVTVTPLLYCDRPAVACSLFK